MSHSTPTAGSRCAAGSSCRTVPAPTRRSPWPTATRGQGPWPGALRAGLRRGGLRRPAARPPQLRRQRRPSPAGHRPLAADRRLAPRHLLPGEPARGRRRPDRPVGHELCRRPRDRAGRHRPPAARRGLPGADHQRFRTGAAPHRAGSGHEAGGGLRRGRARPGPRRGPRTQAVVGDDPAVPASYRTQEAIDFYLQPVPEGVWSNEVTVRSNRLARMYEPGTWVTRVSPRRCSWWSPRTTP